MQGSFLENGSLVSNTSFALAGDENDKDWHRVGYTSAPKAAPNCV